MSYNITRFKLKSVSLTLPRGFRMQEFSKQAWGEIRVDPDLETWEYNQYGEGLQMKGEVTAMGLQVTGLHCRGEGSGSDYHDLLVPLFEKFSGDLEAGIVWEGGDTIERVSIVEGVLTETEIEI